MKPYIEINSRLIRKVNSCLYLLAEKIDNFLRVFSSMYMHLIIYGFLILNFTDSVKPYLRDSQLIRETLSIDI